MNASDVAAELDRRIAAALKRELLPVRLPVFSRGRQ